MTSGFDILLVHPGGRATQALTTAPSGSIVSEILNDLGPSDHAKGAVGGYLFWLARYLLPPEATESDPALQSLIANSRCALRVTLAPEIWGVRWVKWENGEIVRWMDSGISDVDVDEGSPLESEQEIAWIESGQSNSHPLGDVPAGDWDIVTFAGKTYIKVPDEMVPEHTPLGSFFTTDDPGVMFLHVVQRGGKTQLAHDPDEIAELAEDSASFMDIHDAALTVLQAETGLGDPHGWSVECEVHRAP